MVCSATTVWFKYGHTSHLQALPSVPGRESRTLGGRVTAEFGEQGVACVCSRHVTERLGGICPLHQEGINAILWHCLNASADRSLGIITTELDGIGHAGEEQGAGAKPGILCTFLEVEALGQAEIEVLLEDTVLVNVRVDIVIYLEPSVQVKSSDETGGLKLARPIAVRTNGQLDELYTVVESTNQASVE